VAAAVHLEDLLHVRAVQDRRVRVPVVVRLEVAGEVGPGAVGWVRGLVLAVAFADRDARPWFRLDVDGLPGAVALGVESLGGRSQDVVGVVGPAWVPASRAEEEAARGGGIVVVLVVRVAALACRAAVVEERAAARRQPVLDGPLQQGDQEGRNVEHPV
jgi:hypothetical protein